MMGTATIEICILSWSKGRKWYYAGFTVHGFPIQTYSLPYAVR